MALTPYNLPQTVFMLSLGSNALFGKMGLQADLQAQLQAFLAGVPATNTPSPFFTTLNFPSSAYPCLALGPNLTQGDWRAVWGPVVYQAALNPGATNAMYVAHSPSLKLYVVAIAGTNPTGDTALFVEDLDVGPSNMVQWPPTVEATASPQTLNWATPATVSPAAALIDQGTADGISALYTMRDPATQATLSQFLSHVSQPGQTLVFTGHSLGGALAPTMAMLLYPNAAASANPNNATLPNLASNWANVYVLATAGPTPGTVGFARLFSTPTTTPFAGSTAPDVVSNPPANVPTACSGPYAWAPTGAQASSATWQFGYWNMIYANSYDVVPRAWNALANLVGSQVPPSNNYQSFFAAGSDLASGLLAAGPDTAAAVKSMQNKSGYGGGDMTPYYVPCLQHYPFNGSWGTWTPGATLYPTPWIAATPPSQASPAGVIGTMDELLRWVLNAHLGQYSQAFLGYPCPTIADVTP